jgi:hypothetical protein
MCKILFIGLLASFGCNTPPPPGGTKDLSVTYDLAGSICGEPGDAPVNTLGVGKFCVGANDCAANGNVAWKATLCSTALSEAAMGDPAGSLVVNFCTAICDKSFDGKADPAECGDNALCQCLYLTGHNLLGCGCTPTKCGTLTARGDGGI